MNVNEIEPEDCMHKLNTILGKNQSTYGELMSAFANLVFIPVDDYDDESISKVSNLKFLQCKENDTVSGLMVYQASLGEGGATNFKIHYLLDADSGGGKLRNLTSKECTQNSNEFTEHTWVDDALKHLISHIASRPPMKGNISIETEAVNPFLHKLMAQYDIHIITKYVFKIFTWEIFSFEMESRQGGSGQGSSSGNKEDSSQDEEMGQKIAKKQPRYLIISFDLKHISLTDFLPFFVQGSTYIILA